MSRGLGAYQQRVVERLGESEETIEAGLSLADLRGVLPGDRSNRRRVLRSLVARDLVAWEILGDEPPRLKLTWLAAARALWRLACPYSEEAEVRSATHVRTDTHVRTTPRSKKPISDHARG